MYVGIVLPSANSVLENIGSIYPFNIYDVNSPFIPILRRDSAVCCMMFIDLLDDDVQWDENTLGSRSCCCRW
jgi:hypothetical protein